MYKTIVFSALALTLISCKIANVNPLNNSFPSFSTEAHRGGRGLMPENTIPAMIYAIDIGVTTLEMDTHVSSDGKVFLSHDHYINPLFILDPAGNEIPETDAQKFVLYQMTYDQISKYDAGTK
ncbi:MAG: glycerophosphodiester phosphodiesterase family protein [Daejeonella sp.]